MQISEILYEKASCWIDPACRRSYETLLSHCPGRGKLSMIQLGLNSSMLHLLAFPVLLDALLDPGVDGDYVVLASLWHKKAKL